MSTYINACHYAERLRQLRQEYSSAGWQSAIDTALCILADISATDEEPVRQGNGCEYCDGRAYSENPLTVTTVCGRRIELAFEYCPKCGRKL